MKVSGINKVLLREIVSSYSRYLSLMGMIAIGVFVLVGLMITSPIMRATADKAIAQEKTFDLKLESTYGLNEDDKKVIVDFAGNSEVEFGYSKDLVTTNKDVIRIESLSNSISVPTVVNGRLPVEKNEIILDVDLADKYPIKSVITFHKETDKVGLREEGDYDLISYNFTVVGYAHSMDYMNSSQKGSSLVGTGSLNGFAYVLLEAFEMDNYSFAKIDYPELKDVSSASSIYQKTVTDKSSELKTLFTATKDDRLQGVQQEILDSISDGEKKVLDAKKELADAQIELDDALKDIEKGKVDYSSGQSEFRNKIAEAKDKIASGEKDLDTAAKDLDKGKKELESGAKELADGEAEFEKGKKEYEDGLSKFIESEKEYNDGVAKIEQGKIEYEQGLAEIIENEAKLNQGLEEYNQGKAKLVAAKAELDVGKIKLDASRIELESGKALLAISKATAESGLAEAQASLNALNAQKAELTAQLAAIQASIDALDPSDPDYEESLASLNAQQAQLNAQAGAIDAGIAAAQAGVAMAEQGLAEIAVKEAELAAGEAQLEAGEAQYQQGLAEYNAGLAELNGAHQKLMDGFAQLEEGKAKLEAGRLELEDGELELAKGKEKLDAGRKELGEAKDKLTSGEQELIDARSEYQSGLDKWNKGKEDYDKGLQEIDDAKVKLTKEEKSGVKKLLDAKAKLEKGISDYMEGKLTFESEELDALIKIADAEKDLQSARDTLKRLKSPAITVSTRFNTPMYDYYDNASRVVNLTYIFPVFFYLIAILVSLTTMTRMVDEKRGIIGTLKALGYERESIANIFLIYGSSASIIGGLIGVAGGHLLLAPMIIKAYSTNTILAPATPPFYLWPSLLGIGLGLLSTGGVAYLVVRSSLKENAATLMRPKLPQIGARIFLERIKPLWNRMSFSYKVTARNIFRYKKRMLMTIFGIIGCTALLYLGFAMQGSLQGVIVKQYDELIKPELLAIYDKDFGEDSYLDYIGTLASDKNISQFTGAYYEPITIDLPTDSRPISANLLVTEKNNFDYLITLRKRSTGEKLLLEDTGAIITEKLAKLKKVSVGDLIKWENLDGKIFETKVIGITENYASHYIYMSKAAFEEINGAPKNPNSHLIDFKSDSPEEAKRITRALLNNKSVMATLDFSYMKNVTAAYLKAIKLVVIIIILLSMTLASIVLNNLTSINVAERIRELCTIKVLGFYDLELTKYIFREIWGLTIIGIIVGFGAGAGLHQAILKVTTANDAMLDPRPSYVPFVMSALITMAITIIVELIMSKKLKNLDMVEALKAVE
ncbi:MAG: FtsX-like permease family protein [Tissierellia bacterium]|nr:FtsX-like permease family protein [Tissierellia bacterium]